MDGLTKRPEKRMVDIKQNQFVSTPISTHTYGWHIPGAPSTHTQNPNLRSSDSAVGSA
jgi:hypothetical protein